jgi:hypothetical protein
MLLKSQDDNAMDLESKGENVNAAGHISASGCGRDAGDLELAAMPGLQH